MSPVWRLSVYQRPKELNAIECADWDPDAQNKNQRPNVHALGTGTEIRADRCIYLAQFNTTDTARLQQLKDMDTSDGVEFFTTLDVPPVRPGRFMVIGSGEMQDGSGRKVLNSNVYGANIGDRDNSSGSGGSKQRRIELRPNDTVDPIKLVEPSNSGDQRGDELTYQGPDGLPICDVAVITNALSSVAATSLSRKFTITEPAAGYPGDDPSNFPPTGPSYVENIPGQPALEGRYGNVAQPAAYDRPHDDVRADREERLQLLNNFDTNDPLMVECFSMIYLQRLANPLLPFDKDTNPYRTVDGMSANVSLFNGVVGNPAHPSGEAFQTDLQSGSPDGRIQFENRRAEPYLASLQRGYAQSRNIGAQYKANVLGYEPPNVSLQPGGAVRGFHAPRINQFRPNGTARHAINAIPDMTLGRLNHAFMSVADQTAIKNRTVAATDGLTPEEPFPWLTWNNRPYAGAGELLLVPRSRSSQLLQEFSAQANTGNPFSKGDVPRRPSAPGTPRAASRGPAYLGQQTQGVFGHLPNMFLAESPEITRIPDAPAGLFRVLDYVHVPSPFVKTETWLNPFSFGNTNVTSVNDPRYLRQPPFNRISEYREPGRVNLNTVVSADVWDGGLLHRNLFTPANPWNLLTNNYQKPDLTAVPLAPGHLGPRFIDNNPMGMRENGLVEARRGYPGMITASTTDLDPDDMMLLLDSRVPTFFANPFRSANAGNLVPLPNLQRPDSECTQLRRQAFNTGLDGVWGKVGDDDNKNGTDDLGEFDPNDDIEDEDPLFAGTSTAAYNDADRNAYFKMQPMTRLSSMTTTRSNVYAVWVTVGFFEVEEAPDWVANDPYPDGTLVQDRFNNNRDLYDRVYPEGYMLGREAGNDTGDIRRVREFAMIDRTVPVAFEPGKNHNVDKAIRLRRRIE